MLNKMILSFLLLIISTGASAQSSAELFHNGNLQYEKGEYDKAADNYRSIVNSGVESPEVWYNLGNTYYKLNMLGPAVLSFERAKRLAPQDENINYNLKATNLLITDKITPLPENFLITGVRNILGSFTSAGLLRLLLTVYLASILIYIVTLFMSPGRGKRVSYVILGVLGFTFVVTTIITGVKIDNDLNNIRAVVMVSEMSVASAPEEIGEELFILHEGTAVEIIGGSESWAQIKITDGKAGWVPTEMLEVI